MEASTAVSSRLIGAFFVEKGLVTQEQLEIALRKQEESGERLGEIIVAEFGVSRLELASVLAEQWAEFERDAKARDEQAASAAAPAAPAAHAAEPAATPVEPQLRRPIGEIFLERGFVSSDDLERALDVQRATGTRLGEVLVEQGSLSRLDLASALAEQWSTLQKLRPPEPLEPQPWQNGAPSPAPAQAEVPADLRRSLEELAERVRAVERASATTPWNEDLRLLADNVRAAIATVEERVASTATRVDPAQLEALGAALDDLRERVEEPTARLDAVERRLGELPSVEALEKRLEARLAELRAAVEGSVADAGPADDLTALRERLDELAACMVAPAELEELRAQVAALAGRSSSADEVAVLRAAVDELSARAVSADDLAALQARLDEMALRVVVPEALAEVRAELAAFAARPVIAPAAIDGLRDRVDALEDEVASAPTADPELAARVAALAGESEVARTGIASLASQVEQLAALRPRVDEIASRLPGEAAVEELRRALDELAERVSTDVPREEHDAQINGLLARVEELGARVESIDTRNTEPSGPRLREILDGLRAEIGSLAQRPVVDADALEGRLAALEQRGPDPAVQSLAASVEEQRARIDDRLDELASRTVDPAVVDELRAKVGEVADRVAAAAEAEAVEVRLAELERRLADSAQVDEIRAELGRVAESAAGERASLEHALRVRVDELVAAVPATEDVATLRTRLEELAARPAADDELRARVEELAERVERTSAAAEAHLELRVAVARLEETHVDESNAAGARLAGIEGALAALDGVEWRLQTHLEESVAVRAAELEHRLEDTNRRLDALTALEERIEALKADIDRYPGPGALDEVAAGLRAELARLADRLGRQERALAGLPEPVDPTARLDDLALRLDGQARLTAERLGKLGEDLRARVAESAETARREASDVVAGLAGRVDEIDHRLGGLAHRDEVHGSIAEHAAAVAAELDALRRANAEREQSLAVELRDRSAGIERGLGETRDLVESVRAETAGRIEESASALRNDLDGHATEIGARFVAQQAELAALRSQLEELQAAAASQAEWRDRVESGLNDRIAELERRVVSEASETRALVEGLRADDLEAARIAGAELVARLDDLAIRTAAAADEAERALRSDLYGLAATVEEKEAAGIEAREDMRAELERAASSMGWRLERIEETLASDEAERLRAAVAELERRLDQQVAQQEEQVRVTERALRKGLASLGERLADTQTAYLDAGNALRRSIERLGAAVVEADARLADQIPVSEVDGYVAFAPTSEGYRLVQVPGKAPELGATVQIEGIEGPLVVTRFGRSPLPLDSRPCAYLDR